MFSTERARGVESVLGSRGFSLYFSTRQRMQLQPLVLTTLSLCMCRELEASHLGGGAHAHTEDAALAGIVRLLEGDSGSQQLMHSSFEESKVMQAGACTDAQSTSRGQCARHCLSVEESKLCAYPVSTPQPVPHRCSVGWLTRRTRWVATWRSETNRVGALGSGVGCERYMCCVPVRRCCRSCLQRTRR
jgi:hypothetical protein